MSVLGRLARMDRAEFAWRTRAALRIARDRALAAVRRPRWRRSELIDALAPRQELDAVRDALEASRWQDAHAALARHFAAAPQRFPIGASARSSIVGRIRREFPHSDASAAGRADRIVAGEYDLLGYVGLQFRSSDDPASTLPDWHADPVHGRRAPLLFWSKVPYLDAACGDHKIIWELNRHQHWLALGRAWWLTGNAVYRDRFIEELEGWLAANPPLTGINWASMLELAFRSMSWTWALHFFVEPHDSAAPWLVDLLLALDRQLTQVERNLSYYFSPNTHLLGEALALYVCGRALPELAASNRRADTGRRVLLNEIRRQIAPDGGHCERSAHYHRYTLDFYSLALVVARLTGDAAADEFEHATAQLAFAARLLADNRGRLPHLGDDDGGALFPIAGRAVDDARDSLAIAAALVNRTDLQIGATPEEALWMVAAVPESPRNAAATATGSRRGPRSAWPSGALPHTGYYVSRSASGNHLVMDAGPHGYQNGGHAHADALSLTLTVRGLPLVIDPGTASYTVDAALRDRMRSSALHNTVVVNGDSQSEPRGPFHWARTANGRAYRWRTNDAFDYFDGAHDGYVPLTHRRRVLAIHDDIVIVADLIDGSGVHEAAAHWHLDPRWFLTLSDDHVTCRSASERVVLWTACGGITAYTGDRRSGLGWHSPVYGLLEPTTTLRVAHGGPAPLWLATVFELDATNPIRAVDWIPVWTEAGTTAHAAALRIVRAGGADVVMFCDPTVARPLQGRETDRWRFASFETDARMVFCRVGADGRVRRLGLVDGSLLRGGSARPVHLALPRPVPDLHLDLGGDARIAGPAFGARLLVGSDEWPLDVERRAMPRARTVWS